MKLTIQTIQDRRSGDATPSPGPSYSAEDLMGEVYLGLWKTGVIPPGPMRDPAAAVQAPADLLRAFGITPAGAA